MGAGLAVGGRRRAGPERVDGLHRRRSTTHGTARSACGSQRPAEADVGVSAAAPVVAVTSVAALDAPAPSFRSGRPELDQWRRRRGLSATRAGAARVYLGYREAEVVGYIALSAGAIDPVPAGTRTGKGMPRHPIPAVLLARMAAAEKAQRQGVGRELVAEAAGLTLAVARLVAVRALVVDALDEPAAGFYEHVGFTRNQANPMRLEIPVKDLELAAGAEQRP